MSINRRSAIAAIAVLLTGLPVAAQDDARLLETMDQKLAAVKSFEYGGEPGPLAEIERVVFSLPADSKVRGEIEQKLIEALETAETNAAKNFLCSQLRVIGTEQCTASLAKLLTDPGTSAMAIYALGRLESAAASQALLEALGKTTGATQAGIINALADRRCQDTKPALMRIMKSTETEVVQRACARALGRLGGQDATELLLAKSRDAKGALAVELQNALLEAADAMLASGDRKRAASTYAAVLELSSAPQFNVAALRGLVYARPDEATELLVAEILKGDASTTRNAIALTAEVPGPSATSAFAALIEKLNPADKVLMIRALGRGGHVSASPTLVAAATDSDGSIRIAALEALGGAGDADSVSVLLEAATGEGARSLVARRSLLLLSDDSAHQELVGFLSADRDAVTAEAARALAGRGYAGALPQLMKLARTASDVPRHAAIEALGVLAKAKDLKPLITLAVTSKNQSDQELLVEAVAKLFGRINADDRVIPILDELQTASDESKPILMLLLGKTGSTQAIGALRAGLKNNSAAVKNAAIRALAQWPDATVSDDLLGVIRTTRDQSQKQLALQGYVRLANISNNPMDMFENVLLQVDDVADKKLVLEGLGLTADSPAAIDLALQSIGHRELAPTAGLATLRIAHRLRNSHTKLARVALDQVVEKVDHDDVRRRAQEVINEMDKYADHILQWVGVGPFMEKGKDGAAIYETVFDPEKFDPEKPNAKHIKWKPVTSGIGSWDINLESMFGGFDHCAAYLRTRVWSPAAQEALLEMGSDDAVKTWLNGQLVYDKWTVQGASPRQHRVNVSLKKGWNDLMLKVVDFEGGWVVGCRFRARDGTALERLKIAAE